MAAASLAAATRCGRIALKHRSRRGGGAPIATRPARDALALVKVIQRFRDEDNWHDEGVAKDLGLVIDWHRLAVVTTLAHGGHTSKLVLGTDTLLPLLPGHGGGHRQRSMWSSCR